jgi:hypothetical protein
MPGGIRTVYDGERFVSHSGGKVELPYSFKKLMARHERNIESSKRIIAESKRVGREFQEFLERRELYSKTSGRK